MDISIHHLWCLYMAWLRCGNWQTRNKHPSSLNHIRCGLESAACCSHCSVLAHLSGPFCPPWSLPPMWKFQKVTALLHASVLLMFIMHCPYTVNCWKFCSLRCFLFNLVWIVKTSKALFWHESTLSWLGVSFEASLETDLKWLFSKPIHKRWRE